MQTVISRQSKYTTKNPIYNHLTDNFFKCIKNMLSDLELDSILDAGCGEGILLLKLSDLFSTKNVCAIDLENENIERAKQNISYPRYMAGSIYKLPYESGIFDLVICTEVLEHLQNPLEAIQELKRVSKRYCVLSVPNEPIWSISNFLRGSYLTNLGNTPGHIQHWNRNSFKALISGYFNILKFEMPFPWLAALCEKEV